MAQDLFVPPQSGEVLDGRWRIERLLGEGGMGTVYLARDEKGERTVALKVIATDSATTAEARARFEREARLLGSLSHPNLVPVYAVGRKGLLPYVVMKYLEGETLRGWMQRNGVANPRALAPMVSQLCEGLSAMHSRNLVHRDVKPSNVLVEASGHVTLLDLGVARTPGSTLTRTGASVGTPRYMSPEQFRADREIDHRSDLYSLGVVLFEALTGRPPFVGATQHLVMLGHCTQPPPDPMALNPDLPEPVAKVVLRALEKNVKDRFQSAAAFAAAFAQASAKSVEPSMAATIPARGPQERAPEELPTESVSDPPGANGWLRRAVRKIFR